MFYSNWLHLNLLPYEITSPVANFLICITLGKNQWNRELAGWMDLKHYHHFFPSLLYNTHRELYPRFLSNWPIGCSNRKCLQFWRQIVTNTSFITLKPIKVKLGFIFDIMKNGILLPKLFLTTMRKNCSSDWEKLMKFEAEGLEFVNFH